MSNPDIIVWENALKEECSIPICSRNVYAKTLCNMHYQRNRYLKDKNITPDNNWVVWFSSMNSTPRQIRKKPDGEFYQCSVDKCSKDVRARGLCLNHYMQERRQK